MLLLILLILSIYIYIYVYSLFPGLFLAYLPNTPKRGPCERWAPRRRRPALLKLLTAEWGRSEHRGPGARNRPMAIAIAIAIEVYFQVQRETQEKEQQQWQMQFICIYIYIYILYMFCFSFLTVCPNIIVCFLRFSRYCPRFRIYYSFYGYTLKTWEKFPDPRIYRQNQRKTNLMVYPSE